MTQVLIQGEVVKKPVAWLKKNPANQRSGNDPGLAMLRESIKVWGILVPLLVTAEGLVIDGHRRLLVENELGEKEVPVIITNRMLSDTEIALIMWTHNENRAEFRPYDKWMFCVRLMSGNATWQLQDLAAALHLDPSMVTRLLSPSKCIEAVKDALRDGKLGISDCYAISKLPPDQQAGLLDLKLSGASRDQIELAGRRNRNGRAASVKLSRVKIAMPRGATVVISGNELSMAEVVELLSEVLKEAKKSAETFDVKTWVKMMADKSKAG